MICGRYAIRSKQGFGACASPAIHQKGASVDIGDKIFKVIFSLVVFLVLSLLDLDLKSVRLGQQLPLLLPLFEMRVESSNTILLLILICSTFTLHWMLNSFDLLHFTDLK